MREASAQRYGRKRKSKADKMLVMTLVIDIGRARPVRPERGAAGGERGIGVTSMSSLVSCRMLMCREGKPSNKWPEKSREKFYSS